MLKLKIDNGGDGKNTFDCDVFFFFFDVIDEVMRTLNYLLAPYPYISLPNRSSPSNESSGDLGYI